MKIMQKSTNNEITLMKRYEQMLQELEILIKQGGKSDVKQKQGEGAPVVLGGQPVDEQDFENENLCQICCFQMMDTEFVPCQHQTCKKCIQTHMLNNERCPFCNAEIK
jgi:hypothetical protein